MIVWSRSYPSTFNQTPASVISTRFTSYRHTFKENHKSSSNSLDHKYKHLLKSLEQEVRKLFCVTQSKFVKTNKQKGGRSRKKKKSPENTCVNFHLLLCFPIFLWAKGGPICAFSQVFCCQSFLSDWACTPKISRLFHSPSIFSLLIFPLVSSFPPIYISHNSLVI